jgi:hypothetical protein|tara:strand:+ start:307 stop:492 length:186 start_codon:yes stop_codon:yes gene_type:complete
MLLTSLRIAIIILIVVAWFASYKVWIGGKQQQETTVKESFWQSGDKVQFSVNGKWIDAEVQ